MEDYRQTFANLISKVAGEKAAIDQYGQEFNTKERRDRQAAMRAQKEKALGDELLRVQGRIGKDKAGAQTELYKERYPLSASSLLSEKQIGETQRLQGMILYFQKWPSPALLRESWAVGRKDFVSELIARGNVNSPETEKEMEQYADFKRAVTEIEGGVIAEKAKTVGQLQSFENEANVLAKTLAIRLKGEMTPTDWEGAVQEAGL